MNESHNGHIHADYGDQAVVEHGHNEHIDEKQKRDVLNRLKSVEGHVRGIERMIEEDVYCVDVIKQTLAVQRAIDKINALILENHLNTCVTTALRSENSRERERVIGEIVDVFEATNKI